jgi:septum formation protein
MESETTTVTVATLSDEEIEEYIHTGEPMDKAGAYGIQGMFSRWVTGVEGDYSNVVGLPVARVCAMLKQAGVI